MRQLSNLVKKLFAVTRIDEKLGLSGNINDFNFKDKKNRNIASHSDNIVEVIFAICSKDRASLEECILQLVCQSFSKSKDVTWMITSLTKAIDGDTSYSKKLLSKLLKKAVEKGYSLLVVS